MKFYKKWVKGRERRALLYMSMAPCFLIASILLLHFLAPELPRMIKYYLYYVSFLIGLLVFGPKAMKNATYKDKRGFACSIQFLGWYGSDAILGIPHDAFA